MLLACCLFSSCLISYGLFSGALAATGIEKDEDGGIWNWDAGTYTDPTGVVHQIADTDAGGGSTTTTTQPPAGVTMTTDGGMVVESGTMGTGEDQNSGNTSPGLTQEEWEARWQKAVARNGEYTETWYLGPEKEPVPVDVVYMGLARSRVVLGGQETMVNTCDLIWATSAPEDKVIAVVDANRVGYAALRAKTSTKAFILDHCITQKVVRVLSVGENWCMVDYEGIRGYVLTAALSFYPNTMQGYDTGLIGIKGRVTGKSTIKVRAKAKQNARILGDYVVGTPLTIFNRDDKWCEVDVAGFHCYILTEYVAPDPSGALTASSEEP